MNKLFLASISAATVLFFAVPANAYCGHYAGVQDGGCTSPPAQVNNGYTNGYGGNGWNNGYSQYQIQPLPCFFFCGSRKPKQGELRQLADGTSVSYDKATNNWKVVNKPSTQPRGVYSDRDTYFAQ